MKFSMSSGEPLVVAVDVTDAAWHNVSLTTTATNVTLAVDGQRGRTQSRAFASVFPLDSLDIVTMTLGGGGSLPDGRTLSGELGEREGGR